MRRRLAVRTFAYALLIMVTGGLLFPAVSLAGSGGGEGNGGGSGGGGKYVSGPPDPSGQEGNGGGNGGLGR